MLTEESQKKITEIRDSGSFCCITMKSDYNFLWDIYLTMSELSGKNDNHSITHTACHEDLNDAINDIYEQVKDLI